MSGAAEHLAPHVLSIAHWDRILATDIEQCPKCHGRLRVIQSITEPAVAHAILDRLGVPTEVPTAERARDPTDDEARADCG